MGATDRALSDAVRGYDPQSAAILPRDAVRVRALVLRAIARGNEEREMSRQDTNDLALAIGMLGILAAFVLAAILG